MSSTEEAARCIQELNGVVSHFLALSIRHITYRITRTSMDVASALTTLLLNAPMPLLPANTWVTAAPALMIAAEVATEAATGAVEGMTEVVTVADIEVTGIVVTATATPTDETLATGETGGAQFPLEVDGIALAHPLGRGATPVARPDVITMAPPIPPSPDGE